MQQRWADIGPSEFTRLRGLRSADLDGFGFLETLANPVAKRWITHQFVERHDGVTEPHKSINVVQTWTIVEEAGEL